MRSRTLRGALVLSHQHAEVEDCPRCEAGVELAPLLQVELAQARVELAAHEEVVDEVPAGAVAQHGAGAEGRSVEAGCGGNRDCWPWASRISEQMPPVTDMGGARRAPRAALRAAHPQARSR